MSWANNFVPQIIQLDTNAIECIWEHLVWHCQCFKPNLKVTKSGKQEHKLNFIGESNSHDSIICWREKATPILSFSTVHCQKATVLTISCIVACFFLALFWGKMATKLHKNWPATLDDFLLPFNRQWIDPWWNEVEQIDCFWQMNFNPFWVLRQISSNLMHLKINWLGHQMLPNTIVQLRKERMVWKQWIEVHDQCPVVNITIALSSVQQTEFIFDRARRQHWQHSMWRNASA